VAEILDLLQEDHRVIREQLARVGRPEAARSSDRVLAEQAHEIAARLRDRRQTTFHWVTLPEEMSLAESEDAIAALERRRLHVPEIVVNRVLPDAPPCPICDRRRSEERRVVAAIRKRLGRGRRISVVYAAIDEPRGRRGAGEVGGRPAPTDRGPPTREGRPRGCRPALKGRRIHRQKSLDAIDGASLLFFGGKGGVGKDDGRGRHRATARAREPVAENPAALDRSGATRSPTSSSIRSATKRARFAARPRNLIVASSNAAAVLAARRRSSKVRSTRLRAAVGASTLAGSVDAGLSVRSPSSNFARELMNLAPPGIDELFGILSVVDARAAHDVIVVDTAPTGHALRLLEMPDAAREWMQVLLRVLLKYRSLVRPGQLAAELVDVSKSIPRAAGAAARSQQTRFIVVTRRRRSAARKETARLLARLRRLQLRRPRSCSTR
jgi:arsenite-transporting ATPase